MSRLLDRQYRLVVGTPITIKDADPLTLPEPPILQQGYVVGSLDPSLSNDFRTEVSGGALEFRDLHLVASIATSGKAGGSKGGNTIIQLYNLSQESIDVVSQDNAQVILEAGYYEDFEGEDKTLPIIFTGQTRSVKTVQSGQDKITIIECTGAESTNNYIKVSKYLEKGTLGDILEYAIGIYGENGVPLGQYVGDAPASDRVDYVQLRSPDEVPLINGFSFTGYLHQLMDKVTAQCGYIWYMVNGRLFVHPRGYTKSVEQYTLSLDIIKSIEPTVDNKKDKISGVSISTFLDARLSIDKQIVIEDGEYSGTYKILTASHDLDNELGAWDTKITCQKLIQ